MPNANPIVSVIMPAYNAAKTIEESIQSVQSQSFRDWELLVIDDCSTDATVEVIERLKAEDKRIRLFRLPRNSGSAARGRNVGFRKARGEFVALLDADDLWLPEKLHLQVEHLRSHPEAGAVCSQYDVFGDPTRVAEWKKMLWHLPSGPIPPAQVFQSTPATHTVMIRRELLNRLGGMKTGPAFVVGEDRELYCRIILGDRMDRLAEALSLTRLHGAEGSLSLRAAASKRSSEWAIYRSLRREGLLPGKLDREFRAVYHYRCAKDALFHDGGGFRQDVIRSLLTGGAGRNVWIMAALLWMPAPMLRSTLTALLKLHNARKG